MTAITTPSPILIPTAAARPSTAPQPARAAPSAWRALVYSKTAAVGIKMGLGVVIAVMGVVAVMRS